jgi:hypothetical protein
MILPLFFQVNKIAIHVLPRKILQLFEPILLGHEAQEALESLVVPLFRLVAPLPVVPIELVCLSKQIGVML